MIGVLGGGQLGAMFTTAARRLGYRIAAWDPDPEAPALRLAHLPIAAPFDDTDALAQFAGAAAAATYEWENVPFSVGRALEERIPVRPSPAILRVLQNRISQKAFLGSRNLPIAPFRAVRAPAELAIPDELGYPALCKTATSGYDGKGQWRITGPADIERLRHLLPADSEWIVERLLTFEKELSVVVVRGMGGEVRSYPIAENVHEQGILRTSRIPAELAPRCREEARSLAHAVVEALDGVGVFCIEMFLLAEGRLLINEVAPRPHNSGHYTLDACSVSQFEQQVRALCGLPLGEIRLLSPAVMVNLLGDEINEATSGEGLVRVLGVPGAKLRVYGKTKIRPGRKMGHVTFLAENADRAWEAAMALRESLADATGDVDETTRT
jgi:5-(carboxyamino)imidazole ribonucleotide synthase